MIAAIGTAAASSNDMLAGFSANLSSVAHIYSAKPYLRNLLPQTLRRLVLNCGYVFARPLRLARRYHTPRTRWSFGMRSPGISADATAHLSCMNKSSGFTDAARTFYQDLIVFGGRLFHLHELQRIRWSVFCAYDRFHTALFKSPVGSIGQTLCLSLYQPSYRRCGFVQSSCPARQIGT